MQPDDNRIEELLRARRRAVVHPVSHPELCNDPEMQAAYAEGGLSRTERVRFQAHLATCDPCCEAVVRLVRLAPDQSAAARVSSPAAARGRAPRFRWLWAAPALAGVALIGSFVYLEYARYTGLVEENRTAAIERAGGGPASGNSPAPVTQPPPAEAPTAPSAGSARQTEPSSASNRDGHTLAKKSVPAPSKPPESGREEQPSFAREAQPANATPAHDFDARRKDERAAPVTIGGPIGGVRQQAGAAPSPLKAQQNKLAGLSAAPLARVDPGRQTQQAPADIPTTLQAPAAPAAPRQQSSQADARDLGQFAPVPPAGAPGASGGGAGAQRRIEQNDGARMRGSVQGLQASLAPAWLHALPPGSRKSLLVGHTVFVVSAKRELLSGAATEQPSWQKVDLPSEARIADVGAAGETLWVLFVDGCVTRSVDGRTPWQPTSCVAALKQGARSIRVSSATSARVYAADGSAFETADDGATWTPVQP